MICVEGTIQAKCSDKPENSKWINIGEVEVDPNSGEFTQTWSTPENMYLPVEGDCKFDCDTGHERRYVGGTDKCMLSSITESCFDIDVTKIDNFTNFYKCNENSTCNFVKNSPYIWKFGGVVLKENGEFTRELQNDGSYLPNSSKCELECDENHKTVENEYGKLECEADPVVGPTDLVFVIDRSGSMSVKDLTTDDNGATRLTLAQIAVGSILDKMLDYLKDSDEYHRFALVIFNNNSIKISDFEKINNEDLIGNKVNFETILLSHEEMKPRGLTSIGGGLELAIDNLFGDGYNGQDRKKAIVLLTDGMQNTAPCLEKANQGDRDFCTEEIFTKDEFKSKNIPLCSVGYGMSVNHNILKAYSSGYINTMDNGINFTVSAEFLGCMQSYSNIAKNSGTRGRLPRLSVSSAPMVFSSNDDKQLSIDSTWTNTVNSENDVRLLVNKPNGDLLKIDSEFNETVTKDYHFQHAPAPAAGKWRAQLIRKHTRVVNGFATDSIKDHEKGVKLVRRQIQRLCPSGCKNVLYFEDGRVPYNSSVYSDALQMEKGKLITNIATISSKVDFKSELWDAFNSHQNPIKNLGVDLNTQFYPNKFHVCSGVWPTVAGKNYTKLVPGEGGTLFEESLELENRGYETFSYNVAAINFEDIANGEASWLSGGVENPTRFAYFGSSQLEGMNDNNLSSSLPFGSIVTFSANNSFYKVAFNEGYEDKTHKIHRWAIDVYALGKAKLMPIEEMENEIDEGFNVGVISDFNPINGYEKVDAKVIVKYPIKNLADEVDEKGCSADENTTEDQRGNGKAIDCSSIQYAEKTFPLTLDGYNRWTAHIPELGHISGYYYYTYVLDFEYKKVIRDSEYKKLGEEVVKVHREFTSNRYIGKDIGLGNFQCVYDPEKECLDNPNCGNKEFKEIKISGDFNNWGETEMVLVEHNTWRITNLELKEGDKFKFDAVDDDGSTISFGNCGTDQYCEEGGTGIIVEKEGKYDIYFDDENKTFTLEEVYDKEYDKVSIEGTVSEEMKLVGDNTWEVTVTVEDGDELEFKIDAVDEKGKTHSFGVCESGSNCEEGDPIKVEEPGTYILTFNDETNTFTIDEVDGFDKEYDKVSIEGTVSEEMKLVDDNTWEVTVTVEDGDELEFRIDAVDEDGEIHSFGVCESGSNCEEGGPIKIEEAGTYEISFDDDRNSYTVEKVGGFSKESDQVYLRGAFNSWGTTASMNLVGDHTWKVSDLTLEKGDAFKFDINGDWSLNYGDIDGDGYCEEYGGESSNIQIESDGVYDIYFYDNNKSYKIKKVGGFSKEYNQVYLKGTFNNWEKTTLMTLVGDHTWKVSNLTINQGDELKFDIYGDWSKSYGDANRNGHCEEGGGEYSNIIVESDGIYNIYFYDYTENYLIEKIGGDYSKNYHQVYLRGTLNSWELDKMYLVNDSTWQIVRWFPADSEFKFDVQRYTYDDFGNWSSNFGDYGADGWVDQGGANIRIEDSGTYRITFDERGQYWIYKMWANIQE